MLTISAGHTHAKPNKQQKVKERKKPLHNKILCMQLRSGGQYELGMRSAQGGGDWTHHQAAETNNPLITCHSLTPGTRYLFRGRAGTVLGFKGLGFRVWNGAGGALWEIMQRRHCKRIVVVTRDVDGVLWGNMHRRHCRSVIVVTREGGGVLWETMHRKHCRSVVVVGIREGGAVAVTGCEQYKH